MFGLVLQVVTINKKQVVITPVFWSSDQCFYLHEYAMTFHRNFVSYVAFNDVMIPFV